MARIKQRKALTSIFHIKDQNDQRVEGFEAISEVLTKYYKGLLGVMYHHRTNIDLQVMELGQGLTIEQQIIHGRYLREEDWWDYTPKSDTSWYWKKLDIWTLLCTKWNFKLQFDGIEAFITSLIKLKMPRKLRSLIQAVANAVIYHIWPARNRLLFKNKVYPVHEVLKEIKG
ncbi:hypothetical protein Cgig2_019936 [Carnegiea gigantea]|uniref:Uncharacterized protein n=1 Tax=Carnegiea gigantea TaxID=171969 RepID=A0A9Q1JJ55_9CARY|nr:hypothetical protein Cgig2_019936 [Carnegiea gigantea]